MRFRKKVFLLMIATTAFLTACASSDSTNAPQNSTNTNQQNFELSKIWDTALVPVSDDYDSAAPVCDEPYGNFRTCEFMLEVTNISKLPQTLEGIYFLETSDGTVYQEVNRQFDSFTNVINPGDTASQWARFSLPFQGEVISRMYRAWGATSEPVFSHTFNPMWEMTND